MDQLWVFTVGFEGVQATWMALTAPEDMLSALNTGPYDPARIPPCYEVSVCQGKHRAPAANEMRPNLLGGSTRRQTGGHGGGAGAFDRAAQAQAFGDGGTDRVLCWRQYGQMELLVGMGRISVRTIDEHAEGTRITGGACASALNSVPAGRNVRCRSDSVTERKLARLHGVDEVMSQTEAIREQRGLRRPPTPP
jgi:ribosomal protein L34E